MTEQVPSSRTTYARVEGIASLKPRPDGIGAVVPFDFALDDELWAYLPAGVRLHVTRTPAREGLIDADLVAEVSGQAVVREAAAAIAAARPAVTVYGCTTGSYMGGLEGERAIRQTISRATGSDAVTTSGALLEAASAVGVSRLAVATPHDRTLAAGLADFLEEAGMEVPSVAYLALDRDIQEASGSTIRVLARRADTSEAQALFLSCTNLPTLELIPELEDELGKPVLAANQVTLWAALRRLGRTNPAVQQALFQVSC
ncbi:MAG: decarboxylase [bacterium]|nr:decarboxylase [bacterium]MDE0287333.1 decarboxylase [bacterium]MDE0439152.1 decarboxylase [bacterium]